MLSTIQADLHRVMENVIKELNCSYDRYKKAEEEAEEARGKAFDLNASNENLTSINANLKSTNRRLLERIKELETELDEARAKAALYDEIVEDAGDCWVGQTIMIKHEPTDLEPASRLYFLRITEDESYRIDMGRYAHLEIWED